MSDDHTTAVVERYLIALAGDTPADPVVRALLDRAVGRLRVLCASLLYRSYPRLTRPPLNLDADELLDAVVERLLKAMREVRPGTVRQFFALANQHIRWELNDLARRLDDQPDAVSSCARICSRPLRAAAPPSARTPGGSSGRSRSLPEDEREVFGLVRIQGLTQAEAAEILGVSGKTVQRRLNRGLLLLAQRLDDLRPGGDASGFPRRRSEAHRMPGDPRVQELIEEILESGSSVEDVCRAYSRSAARGPRGVWRRFRAITGPDRCVVPGAGIDHRSTSANGAGVRPAADLRL